MNLALELCSNAATLIDWFGRFLILAWALVLVCQWRHDRRSRPDPALVARLADEAERRHGAKASWILGAQWNTYRLERAERARTETRRGYILRAVAKELTQRGSGTPRSPLSCEAGREAGLLPPSPSS